MTTLCQSRLYPASQGLGIWIQVIHVCYGTVAHDSVIQRKTNKKLDQRKICKEDLRFYFSCPGTGYSPITLLAKRSKDFNVCTEKRKRQITMALWDPSTISAKTRGLELG